MDSNVPFRREQCSAITVHGNNGTPRTAPVRPTEPSVSPQL
ncbi:MAG: hypothetical protein ACTSWG_06070 [Candidatus Helarchaeota archaeon]